MDILNKVHYLLYNYLINFPKTNKKYSVIFDIDETLLYNTKNINKYFPEIKQITDILKLCHNLNFKIIIITARPYMSKQWTIENLKLFNLHYDNLYFNDNFPNTDFKIKLQKQLSKTHNIILSIGDQWNDIIGLKNCLCIKLPNGIDSNSYFTFNNYNYYNI